MEKKNNKEYAGQVVDVPRSRQRISFTDLIKKMTEAEGDPFLNIFSKKSIYLITLFDFDKASSLVANLPLRDMPLIKKKTDFAEMEIFMRQNQVAQYNQNISETKAEKTSFALVPPAFTRLKTGRLSGKIPGDLLLEADDIDSVKADLLRQAEFLRKNLASYSANQAQIDAIEDAITSYDMGILREIKPKEGLSSDASEGAAADATAGVLIYKTPVKHQKKKNKNGKNRCYSVVITCFPAKEYPYRIEIMNCYAPLGKLSSGITPVYMDKAEDIAKSYIDLTESEWLYILDCLDENTKNTKRIWFSELRQADESNRWNGNNS